jgi:nitrogen regulatory protein PII
MATPQIKVKLDRKRFYVEPSVIVFKEGDTVYALDTITKNIIYSSSDAGAVIQAAYDSLPTDPSGGGKIFIKRGSYDLYTNINLTANRPVIIEGEGMLSTRLFYYGDDSKNVIHADGLTLDACHVEIKNMAIYAGKNTFASSLIYARTARFRAEGLFLHANTINPNNRGMSLYLSGSGGPNIIRDVRVCNADYGILAWLDHTTIESCTIGYCNKGLSFFGGVNNFFSNLHALSCTQRPFDIDTSNASMASAFFVMLHSETSSPPPSYDVRVALKDSDNHHVTIAEVSASGARNVPIVAFYDVPSSLRTRLLGKTFEKRGLVAIPAGQTRVTVSHGLGTGPGIIAIIPLAQPPGKLWVENITSNTLDIVIDTAPTSDLSIRYYLAIT